MDDQNLSRARQILGTMKERRESLSDAVHFAGRAGDHVLIKPKPKKPPLFTAAESDAITRQLNESLRERRERLTRMSGSARTNPTAVDFTSLRAVVKSPSNHSDEHTESTRTSSMDTSYSSPERSPQSSHSTSSSLMTEYPELYTSFPLPPTLEDINEAFGNEVSSDSGKSSNEEAESESDSSSSSYEESSNSSSEEDTSDDDEDDDTPQLKFKLPESMTIRTIRSFDMETSDAMAPPLIVQCSSFDAGTLEAKEPRKISLADLEFPRELTPLLRRMTTPSTAEDQSETDTEHSNDTTTLSTKEERAVYIGNLYSREGSKEQSPESIVELSPQGLDEASPECENEPSSAMKRERQHFDDVMTRSRLSRQAKEILGFSLIQDHEKRRETLTNLQAHVSYMKNQYTGKEMAPNRPPSVTKTEEDEDATISDASSFESTSDSNSSGWYSSGQSDLNYSMLQYNTDDDGSLLSSVLTYADRLDSTIHTLSDYTDDEEEEEEPTPVSRMLFVPAAIADARAGAHGGWYSLAVASGLTKDTPIRVKVVPVRRSPQFLRLSADFRCGAHGSMYDIAVRSGCNVRAEECKSNNIQQKSKKHIPAKGGFYDMAMRSGLTKEVLRSRQPYVVTAKALTDSNRYDSRPEEETDYDCGATGTLYICATSGSVYYLPERTELK